MRALSILVLLIPLTGCITPTEPTVDTDSCIKDMCILTEPEPYWREYRDRFGLEQVPLTHGGRAGGFEVGPGFMVWGGGANDTVELDLYALDFDQSRIIPFGTRANERTLDRIIHGREVAFVVEDMSISGLERFSMWMWSFDNETKWRLPIDLEGDKDPSGYDGNWIVFTNTLRTYRAVELWAYNVHDGRLMQLFQPEPRNRHENGSYETMRTPILHDGIAYYTVLWHHGNISNSWTDIYATDLEKNTTTHIKRLPGIQVNFMDANGDYLTYTNDKEAWALPLKDISSEPIPMPKTKGDNHGPQVDGRWVFYTSRDGLVQDLVVVNLETMKKKIIVVGDEGFMPGFMTIQGDDVYVLAQVVNPYEDGAYYTMRVFKIGRNVLP